MAKLNSVLPVANIHELSNASCAFGVFDGLHRGHQFLIQTTLNEAAHYKTRSVVLTFDKDPDEIFHPETFKKLASNEQRLKDLKLTGIDAVVALPFTREFAALEPVEFLDALFGQCLPHSIHIGADFRFGFQAKGTVKDLKEWAETKGVFVYAHHLKTADGSVICSTRIRKLLHEGSVDEANSLLGHPYALQGVVLHGRGAGTEMGFSTANIDVPCNLQVLGEGVYAAYAYVEDQQYKAAVSVGHAPTFEKKQTASLEVHLLDFEGDLYGKELRIEFSNFLRPLIKFPSIEELIATVKSNISWVQEHL